MENCRVLLINPPTGLYRRDDRCQSKVDEQTVRVVFAPVDLALLAAIVRTRGGEAKVADYPTFGQGIAQFEEDLLAFLPHILMVNTTVHTVQKDMEVLARAKEICPGLMTVMHGEGVAVQAERALNEYPQCDAVFDGEPEDTTAELTSVLEEKPLWEIAGLVCRNIEGRAVRTGKREMIQPLDRLPLPARDLLRNKAYRSPENGHPMTVISAQRGCPSRCIFCPAGSMFGYQVRERAVDDVMAEIRECVEKYGIRDFLFHGDTFTLNKPWVLQLCKAITDAKLKIRWGCNSRVDTMDEERAAALKSAGCWVVAFGFEHGNQNILNNMRKGQRADRAFEAVRICRNHGLMVHGFFLAGLPWETSRTLRQLALYARKLDPDFFDFNIACPLPGTQLYQICLNESLFVEDSAHSSSYARSAVRTFTLSGEDLTQWRRKTLLSMYLRPAYMWRILRHAIRTGTLMHYVQAALQRLTGLLRIRVANKKTHADSC